MARNTPFRLSRSLLVAGLCVAAAGALAWVGTAERPRLARALPGVTLAGTLPTQSGPDAASYPSISAGACPHASSSRPQALMRRLPKSAWS